MFIFDSTVEKTLSRRKALGFKSLVISDDVTSGCEADMSLDTESGCIRINRSDKIVDESVEPEITLVVKEFGVFGNFPSKLEVTICDNYLVVTLIEGAIDVNLDGNVMMASRGVDVNSITCQSLDSVVWVDVETLLSFTKFWCKANEDYPFDYVYQLKVSGDNGGSRTLNMSPIDKDSFLFDISNGGFDVIAEKRALKAQIEQVRNSAKLVYDPSKHYSAPVDEDSDEFVYDPDNYVDDEDDDDFDGYEDFSSL